MTDIDIYDANGNYYTSVNAQLATQYAYGNAEQSSCWAKKKTVSELLFDLPIDGYVSLNIDAISTMNDAVGGVEITIPEDYTVIDPGSWQVDREIDRSDRQKSTAYATGILTSRAVIMAVCRDRYNIFRL